MGNLDPISARVAVSSGVTKDARFQRVLSVALLVFLATALSLIVAAMTRYPGGTWTEPTHVGHSFWGNFFCDLTQQESLSGGPNPAAPLSRAGMLVLAFAFIPFWQLVPLTFPDQARLGVWARRFGMASALASMAVPLTPSLLFAKLHAASSLLAGALGVLAAGYCYVGMLRARPRPLLSLGLVSIALVAGMVNGALYVYFLAGAPLSSATPAAQKVAAIALLTWMVVVAREGLRTVRG